MFYDKFKIFKKEIDNLKTVKIRKGQTRLLKNGKKLSDASMKIDLEHMENLGWDFGEELVVTSDKRTGKLTAIKARED